MFAADAGDDGDVGGDDGGEGGNFTGGVGAYFADEVLIGAFGAKDGERNADVVVKGLLAYAASQGGREESVKKFAGGGFAVAAANCDDFGGFEGFAVGVSEAEEGLACVINLNDVDVGRGRELGECRGIGGGIMQNDGGYAFGDDIGEVGMAIGAVTFDGEEG